MTLQVMYIINKGSQSQPITNCRPKARERSTFSIDAVDDRDGSPHSEQGFDRPDQTVFDLTMDYSDDETLLDWEQYAGMRKFKFWGMDCSLIARFCPFMPCVPQEWYYRLARPFEKACQKSSLEVQCTSRYLLGYCFQVPFQVKRCTPCITDHMYTTSKQLKPSESQAT